MRHKLLLALASLFALPWIGCSSDGDDASQLFEILIENISQDGQLPVRVVFGPALLAVHSGPAPFFTLNQPASPALESFAEDVAIGDLVTSTSQAEGVSLVAIGEDAQPSNQGVLLPGDRYRVVLTSQDQQDKLSLLIGFLQSNDIFAGTLDGVPLFDGGGNPLNGDVTSQLALLDAGTEVNQAPGQGADQPGQQAAPNTGAAENGVVRPEDDQFDYPSVPSMLRITVTPLGELG